MTGAMQVIKKYANRKLYDTTRKQYITLDGIAQLVRVGEPVKVLDNETGEDITASILSQIIVQTTERDQSSLPTTLLASLIQLGSGAFAHLRSRIFAAINERHLLATLLESHLERLMRQGTLSTYEAHYVRRLLFPDTQSDLPETPDAVHDQPHTAEQDNGVPRRSDILLLQAQIEALSVAVEQLFQQRENHETPDTTQS
ncbi:MAG: pesticidal protein Cry15Aa [Chloroflexaceae bacterium]|nr:pesticidal protein Cry15Aa [Chloroflexaceae bacterium]NJO07298.1 pesticidal protein Cry15Aa [Chloroflexaceae bacterium]